MADPGLDRDPALGRRPQVGDVEVGVQDLAERARDRRGGHEQDVRRGPAGLRLELAALLDAEPVLLVDHDQAEIGEADPLLEQGVGPDDDPGPAVRDGLERVARPGGAQRAGQQRDRDPERLEQVAEGRRRAGGRAGRSGRAGRPGGRPRPSRASAYAATAVLPEPTSPWSSRSIGSGRARSERIAAVAARWSTVSSTARPSFVRQRRRERRPDRAVALVGDVERQRARADPLAAPADHPELEGEQLVERQPAERRVARLGVGRVVGAVDRRADPDEALRAGGSPGQVLRVVEPGPVDRLAHRDPEPGRRDPGGQPVDRDDPAGVEEVPLGVLALELRVVEDDREAALLEPAADHERVAGRDPPLDEAPAEPDRLGLAGLVADDRDRPLDPPPVGLLDPDRADDDPGADLLAVGPAHELGDRLHLAPVVVAPRQVEQEVADRRDPEPRPGPPDRGRAGQAARRRSASRAGSTGSVGGGAAGRAAAAGRRVEPAGRRDDVAATATPPRSGTGSGAGRRGGPRPRRPAGPRRSAARASSASASSAPSP